MGSRHVARFLGLSHEQSEICVVWHGLEFVSRMVLGVCFLSDSQLWRTAPEIVGVMNAREAKAFPRGLFIENYG